jgi:hypothetical protein
MMPCVSKMNMVKSNNTVLSQVMANSIEACTVFCDIWRHFCVVNLKPIQSG